MASAPLLRDVATAAGVHPATASRALNPVTRSRVNPATAKRILAAAKRLGYTTNPVARGLRTRRSLMVGVLIPDLTNPIFAAMIRAIEDVLLESGLAPLIASTDNDAVKAKRMIAALRSRQPDGWIIASAVRDDPLVAELVVGDTPTVLLLRTMDQPSAPSVICDDAAGIRAAVSHIVELGHQRIAHLGGPLTTSVGVTRDAAFRSAMRTTRVRLDRKLLLNGDAYSIQAGRHGMSRLLELGAPPTAVVAGNDLIALGAIEAMREAGLACPADISVVGFNDMPLAANLYPALTTVRVPTHDMGVEAARLFLRDLADESTQQKLIVLQPELIIRASTARLR